MTVVAAAAAAAADSGVVVAAAAAADSGAAADAAAQVVTASVVAAAAAAAVGMEAAVTKVVVEVAAVAVADSSGRLHSTAPHSRPTNNLLAQNGLLAAECRLMPAFGQAVLRRGRPIARRRPRLDTMAYSLFGRLGVDRRTG